MAPVTSEPVVATPQVEMPTIPTMEPVAEPTPAVVDPTPVVEPVVPVQETPVVDTPVVEQPNVLSDDVLKAQKDAFLEACSNMFDALVEQFKKNINQ